LSILRLTGGGPPPQPLTLWTSWWAIVALIWAQDGRLALASFVFMPLSACRLWEGV